MADTGTRMEHVLPTEDAALGALVLKAAREWAKGCSCAPPDAPAGCNECTHAFLQHVHGLVLIGRPAQTIC